MQIACALQCLTLLGASPQEVVARLIVQSQQAFFQAQARNAFQARASNVDMFTVVNAEAQYKRKIKQSMREINDELPRIEELRLSLLNVRALALTLSSRSATATEPGRVAAGCG